MTTPFQRYKVKKQVDELSERHSHATSAMPAATDDRSTCQALPTTKEKDFTSLILDCTGMRAQIHVAGECSLGQP